jgi:hypothetical protein
MFGCSRMTQSLFHKSEAQGSRRMAQGIRLEIANFGFRIANLKTTNLESEFIIQERKKSVGRMVPHSGFIRR